MDRSTSPSPGQIVAGRYVIEDKLGEGGAGAVYRVRHVNTHELLALKALHAHVVTSEDAVARFRKEARAPAQIGSEHVVRVTDADTAPELGGAPFLVMELLVGRDLERVVTEEGPLPPATVVEYLRQVARALDKAHRLGIVHRDLKPENLFLTHREDGSPCVKLLDFGIARMFERESADTHATRAGMIFGTPAYMAPEQTLGDTAAVSPRTDVWSLGLTAFRLLFARDYWCADSLTDLVTGIVAGPLPSATERGSTLGPAFDHWLAGCVTRDPRGRFASAGEAVAALASTLGIGGLEQSGRASWHEGAESPPRSSSVPAVIARSGAPAPARGRGTVWAGVAVVGAVLVGGALLVGLVRGRRAGATPAPALVTATEIADAGIAARLDVVPPPSATPPPAAPSVAPSALRSPALDAPGRGPRVAPDGRAAGQPSREQRRRLEALQRLCDQGTFSASECKTKHDAIVGEQR